MVCDRVPSIEQCHRAWDIGTDSSISTGELGYPKALVFGLRRMTMCDGPFPECQYNLIIDIAQQKISQDTPRWSSLLRLNIGSLGQHGPFLDLFADQRCKFRRCRRHGFGAVGCQARLRLR